MREQMRLMEERHAAEIADLRREFAQSTEQSTETDGSELTAEIDDLLDRMDDLEDQARVTPAGRGAFKLLDVSLNALFAAGGSTAQDDEIEQLNAGGHDPNRRGFTVQNVELILKGAVDPYFTATANIVYQIDRDGESQVELEEAYAESVALPFGLRAKVGQYFTNFGRHNPQHPHQWEFVDMPFGWTRMLGGDGMRGPGAQLSWLLPTDTAIEITGSVQNANGETMSSFVDPESQDGSSQSTFGAQREHEVRSLDDLVWSGRATASFDVDDEWTTLFGTSAAFGPNSAGSSARTSLLGLDATARWTSLEAQRGFPFLEGRVEYVGRDYEFDAFTDGSGRSQRSDSLNDETWYVQTVWGFTPDWTVAGRYEDFLGDAPQDTIGLEDRTRIAIAVTHYFSEFSKLRLQVSRDDSDLTGNATSVWLQFEFNLGAHGVHKF